MNRLEKKCLMASALLHGFLFLVFIFGSAFFVSQEKTPILRKLNVVPTRLIDEALSGGGGNPNLPQTDDRVKGQTLAPEPPAPAPVPPPAQPKPQPAEPVKPVVEPPKAEVKKAETAKPKETPKPKPDPIKTEPAKPRIDLSELKPIARKDTEKQKAREEAERQAARDQARRQAQVREQLAKEIGRGVQKLERGFNDGTKVDVGGPGGEAFANYKHFVQMAYENAWIISPELTQEDFVAFVKVVVARDGRIIASRISKPSGSASMDRSVQRALDRVRADGLPPFPAGAPDLERSFTIEFNLKAKTRAG